MIDQNISQMIEFNTVVSSNLILREVELSNEEYDNIKSVYQDPYVIKFLSKSHYSDEDIYERYRDMILYKKLNLQLSIAVICKKTNKFMGFIRSDFYPTAAYQAEHNYQYKDPVTKLSPGVHIQAAYLLKGHQNKGYMTEAFAAILNFFKEMGFNYAFGEIHRSNIASQKLLNKFGFKYYDKAPINLNNINIPLVINNLNNEVFALKKL